MNLRSFSPAKEWTLETLLAGLSAIVPEKAGTQKVERLKTLASASLPGDLCFLSEPRRLKEVFALPAGVACLITPEMVELARKKDANTTPQETLHATLIETKEPKQVWCEIVERIFAHQEQLQEKQTLEHYIDPTAIIAASARLHSPLHIGAYCVIAEGVEIGAGSRIESHCVIEKNVKIAQKCKIAAYVFISNSIIDEEVVIHQACVIGGEEFGIIRDKKNIPRNFPQLGGVRIGRASQIFKATTIGRGALDDTKIGQHVRIGCQSMISHNCEIGDFSIISPRAALSGSTRIGKFVTAGAALETGQNVQIKDRVGIGGQCSFWPNLTLHEGVQLMNGSTVRHSISGDGKIFFGNPARPLREELHRRKKIDRLIEKSVT